jgi:hypothetical protein
MTLAEAQRHIDSFSRPSGFNTYSWRVVKKMALKAWEKHLEGKVLEYSVNYMCKEFYLMIRDENGQFIIPRNRIHSPYLGTESVRKAHGMHA